MWLRLTLKKAARLVGLLASAVIKMGIDLLCFCFPLCALVCEVLEAGVFISLKSAAFYHRILIYLFFIAGCIKIPIIKRNQAFAMGGFN